MDPDSKKKSKLTGIDLYRKNLERFRIMKKTTLKLEKIADMAIRAK